MLNHRRVGLGFFIIAFFFQAALCNESRAQSLPDEIPGLTSFSLQDIDIHSPYESGTKAQTRDSSSQYRTAAQTRQEVGVFIDGVDHNLILEPYSLRTSDFRLLVQDADGRIRQVVSPPPCTYRGVVENDRDSQVTAAIVDGKLNAGIRFGSGDVWYMQPASNFVKSAPASTHVLYRSADVVPPEGVCGVHDTAAILSDQIAASGTGNTMTGSASSGGCLVIKVCEIAFDADFEFYQHNDSSVPATLLDIETVMNGVTQIYEQQLAITYEITEVIVRTTDEDPYPYTSTDPDTLLQQFRAEWNDFHADVRDVAHLFTGKDIDGSTIGLAYNGVVCHATAHYGFSQSTFSASLPSRIALTAHELGHNWNASHCNSEPDCAIMCSQIGGCNGDIYHFSDDSVAAIAGFRDTRQCLDDFLVYGGGCGTEEYPYLLVAAEHLESLVSNPTDWDKHFKLMADIDLRDAGVSIGSIGNQGNPFSGVFDGNGCVISNFHLTVEEPDIGIGFFGCVQGSGAVITKLGLKDPNILAESGNNVGALVGKLIDGKVINCYVAGGSILGNDTVGGLVGYNAGDITDCYATDDVSGGSNLGGLAGYNDSTVANCYSTGKVVGTTEIGIGGLIGDGIEGGVSASFWDTDTSGQLASGGGGTGKTTALMKEEGTFTSAGWDFTSPVWTIDDGIDYPRLFWELRYGGGSGTDADPYLVFTPEQFNNIGANPSDWDKYFKLMANIDLSGYGGEEFNIIGNAAKAFSGVFDGNGFEISDFNYTSARDNIGLFGVVDGADAEIRNMVLSDPNIEAQVAATRVGALVGELRGGRLSDCHVENANVVGHVEIGGLVGFQTSGVISHCCSTGSVSGTRIIGGLVGKKAGGTIRQSYSSGDVTSSEWYCGGLVAVHSLGTISNCYSTVTVLGEFFVGGLVGYNDGSISHCYSAGSVTGTVQIGVGVGGLVGHTESGTVSQSFWDTVTSYQPTSPGGGTGRVTDLMKSKSTFTSDDWDFVGESVNGTEYIWRLCEDEVDYPMLAWQFLPGDFVCPDGINLVDLSFFSSRWLNSNCDGSNGCSGTDIDGSGVIDTADLTILSRYWLDRDRNN